MRQHGTYSMYQAMCRCDACVEANSVYQRGWRNGNSRTQALGRLQRKAYQQALAGLRERYREEFDEMYEQAKRDVGLIPDETTVA